MFSANNGRKVPCGCRFRHPHWSSEAKEAIPAPVQWQIRARVWPEADKHFMRLLLAPLEFMHVAEIGGPEGDFQEGCTRRDARRKVLPELRSNSRHLGVTAPYFNDRRCPMSCIDGVTGADAVASKRDRNSAETIDVYWAVPMLTAA